MGKHRCAVALDSSSRNNDILIYCTPAINGGVLICTEFHACLHAAWISLSQRKKSYVNYFSYLWNTYGIIDSIWELAFIQYEKLHMQQIYVSNLARDAWNLQQSALFPIYESTILLLSVFIHKDWKSCYQFNKMGCFNKLQKYLWRCRFLPLVIQVYTVKISHPCLIVFLNINYNTCIRICT